TRSERAWSQRAWPESTWPERACPERRQAASERRQAARPAAAPAQDARSQTRSQAPGAGTPRSPAGKSRIEAAAGAVRSAERAAHFASHRLAASVARGHCRHRLHAASGSAPARASPSRQRSASITSKDRVMAKEELIELEGLVTEILPDARFRVQLDAGQTIIAYTAGKMKKNRIKTLAGDRVTVEMPPYDLEKGRLIFRHKDERASSGSRPPQRQQFRRK